MKKVPLFEGKLSYRKLLNENKDESAKDRWWGSNHKELINIVQEDDTLFTDILKGGGWKKSEIAAELDGSGKNKAAIVLDLLTIEELDELLGNTQSEDTIADKKRYEAFAKELNLKPGDIVNTDDGDGEGVIEKVNKLYGAYHYKIKGDEALGYPIIGIVKVNDKKIKPYYAK